MTAATYTAPSPAPCWNCGDSPHADGAGGYSRYIPGDRDFPGNAPNLPTLIGGGDRG